MQSDPGGQNDPNNSCNRSFLILFLCMPVFAYAGGANVPLFSFRFPQQDTANGGIFYSNDRHTIDKMNHYGYYAGAEVNGPDGKLREYGSELYGANDSTTFLYYLNLAYNDYFSQYFSDETWRYPKRINRIKNARIMDRMFIAYNANWTFALLADSLIQFRSTQAEKDSLAVKLTADYVIKIDSLFREWYDISEDSLIIHQLAQEINFMPITSDGGRYSFLQRSQSDTLLAYKIFGQIMNSISRKVHDRKNGVLTVLELHLPWTLDDPFHNWPWNRGDSTWVDTLLLYMPDPNAFFCVIHPGDTPSYFSKINNLFFSKLNGRKLGLRFSFASDGIMHLGYNAQYEMLIQINSNIQNNSYLSLYSTEGLDGIGGHTLEFDPDPHWRALSKFYGKPYLYFIDHFSDWGVDTRLWNSTGTVTQNGDEALLISQGSKIVNDTAYALAGSVEASFDNNGESGYQWHGLRARKNSTDFIQIYTQAGKLHTYVFYDSSGQQIVRGQRHDNIQPSGMNNYRIEWSSWDAYFYYNNSYVCSLPFTPYLFDNAKMELASGTDYQTKDMKADSIWTIARDLEAPNIEILATQVFNNPPMARITYHLDRTAFTEVLLERYDVDGGSVHETITVQEADTVGAPIHAEYYFDAADESGYYKWLIQVSGHGSAADSAFGMGFYYDTLGTIGTILASSELKGNWAPLLPKAFSLGQNYPNPFNPSTTISYTIPEGKAAIVSLGVYNLRGQLVKSLVNDVSQSAGDYRVIWDGRGTKGAQVSSGVYFYRLKAGEYVKTRKMVLLK